MTAASATSDGTRLLTAADLADLPEPSFAVQDFIRTGGFNVLFGPSGVGKSFLSLDWSLCVATGLPWYGQAVEQGVVVYVAAEGVAGLHRRVEAWRRARGVESVAGIWFLPEPVNFYERNGAMPLTNALDSLKLAPALIVVDTMARCMVGGDENAARDVGLFIDALDTVRGRYGAATLTVHHTGKSGEDERGSSALRGAADTMVALKPDGAGLKLTCEKQKEAAEFEPWRLHLAESGESCLIRVGTVSDRLAPQELKILESVSASFGTDWASGTKVIEVCEVPKSSVYRALKSLCERGYMAERPVGTQRREYRVTEEGEEHVPNRPKPSHGTSPEPSHPTPLSKGLGHGTEGQAGCSDNGQAPLPPSDLLTAETSIRGGGR